MNAKFADESEVTVNSPKDIGHGKTGIVSHSGIAGAETCYMVLFNDGSCGPYFENELLDAKRDDSLTPRISSDEIYSSGRIELE